MPDWLTLLLAIVLVAYLATLLLIPWVLLKKTVHPTATLAWILSIVFVPFLSAGLLLVFGINRIQRRRKDKHAASFRISQEIRSFAGHLADEECYACAEDRSLAQLSHRLEGGLPARHNHILVMHETKPAFERIEQAILAAKETIHVEYYIWRSDRIGTRLRDALIRKAQEGVAVRFLFDTIGSISLRREFFVPMEEAGITVRPFLPGQTFRERFALNLRNHRKIVVVDGRLGFLSGSNVGDEYLGRDPFMGNLRDTTLEIRGPAVLQLQRVFARDWFYATGEKLITEEIFPEPEGRGDVMAHVMGGGPDDDGELFHTLLFAAINSARESVTLGACYFVPPQSLLMALMTAARRGVRVRILIAHKGTYRSTLLAGRAYYGELLRAGVEIHEYERGLYHAKIFTVDGRWALVGSPNFDMRSLMLNFEVACALYDPRLARQIEEQFERDLQHARKIDPHEWQKRSLTQKIAARFFRLFEPIL